jgi:hypothetical protein
MSTLDVDMHINDLAEFMFLRNINDAIIDLSLGGIENNKDLFFFCLDLFCKGLVYLFGENGKVDIEKVSLDNFKLVKTKMELAGINVKLDVLVEESTTISLVEQDDAPLDIKTYNSVNIHELDSESDDKPLSEYIFTLKFEKMKYNIHFELVHRVI